MIITDITNYINALDLISSEYGIIKYLIGPMRQSSDPKAISYGVDTADITKLAPKETYPHSAAVKLKSSGCGFNNEMALMSTIGEVIERYCATIFDENEIIKNSYSEVSEFSIDIGEYALFHSKQYSEPHFELIPFTPDVEIAWVNTIDLTNGKEVLCPAQLIYLGYTKDSNHINFPTSTGLACHSDPYQAILNCLYESVERDSFTITWENEIVPPKIIIDHSIQKFIDQFFPVKYEWHFFNMTYDIFLPTVLCLCFGKSDFGDFVVVSAATRSNFSSAIKKAILEAAQGIPFLRWQLDERRDWNPKTFSEITSFEEHPLFYHKNKKIWTVFDKYRKAIPTQEHVIVKPNEINTQDEVARIIKMFKDKGYNVLYKDLTTPDIKAKNFYVIKTYIPQLIQLGGVYPYYYRGGKRLYSVPSKCGYIKKEYEQLNPIPHPFP
jgi:bacteriocin biosynthesis docking scaffold, SagD family